MKHSEFEKVLNDTLDGARAVMSSKSKEYATDGNKMHNFDQGARMTGKSREEVLYGFALKHHISIADMRENAAKGVLPSLALVNEKFGDAINYLILEKASIVDRIQKQNIKEEARVFSKCTYTPPPDGNKMKCEPTPITFEEYEARQQLARGNQKPVMLDKCGGVVRGCNPSSGCGMDSSLCDCQ